MNLANQNAPATKKQLWALFCGTGLRTNGCSMSVRQASNLIDNMKNGIDIESDLRSFGATGQVKKKVDWKELYEKADKAGREAANNCVPTPMIVSQRVNPLDDNSRVEKEYFVPQGVCGFAWVNIKPGNHPFSNWLKKNNLARKDSYYGGVTIWVGDYGQSMELKEAYAGAFARTLRENGIEKSYMGSRMD